MQRKLLLGALTIVAACSVEDREPTPLEPNSQPRIAHLNANCAPRAATNKFKIFYTCGQVVNVRGTNDLLQDAAASAAGDWGSAIAFPGMFSLTSDPAANATIWVKYLPAQATQQFNNPYYCGQTNNDGQEIVITRSESAWNCSEGFHASHNLTGVVLHELSHAVGMQGHLENNAGVLSPVAECTNTLRNDRVFNTVVCPHEGQRALYYYGLRNTDPNTGKHMMTGITLPAGPLDVSTGDKSLSIVSLDFLGKVSTFTPPDASTIPVAQLLWVSSNPSVAFIQGSGKTVLIKKGAQTGTATISVSYSGSDAVLAYERFDPFSDGTILVQNPAPPRQLVKVAGDTTGTTNTALVTPPKVKVTQGGVAVAGATVTFTVTSGGGNVSPASALTNASGEASAAWTLGPAAGMNTLKVSTANAPDLTLSARGIAPLPTVTSFAYNDCSSYVATNTKTYNTFTLGWTLTGSTTGVTYEVGENTTNNSATATVVNFGPASALYSTLGNAAPLAGPYLKGTSSNLRYWWVRVKNSTTTGPWRALAAPKFPMETKTCVPPI